MTIRPNGAQLLSRYLRRLEKAKPDTFSRLIPTKNDYCPNEGTLVRIGGISHHTLLGLPFVLLSLTWQTSLKSHFIISISTHQFQFQFQASDLMRYKLKSYLFLLVPINFWGLLFSFSHYMRRYKYHSNHSGVFGSET